MDHSSAGRIETESAEPSDFVREKPRDLKSVLGIFYTPAPLAEMLVDWAVRDAQQTIFEPSFGGCGFLNATARRLTELGHPRPWEQIFGCDKDRRVFKFLPEEYQKPHYCGQFQRADFLRLDLSNFPAAPFDAVLGNPPYVSRHTMTTKQIDSAESAIKECGYVVSSRASLWAYFILHGLKFLRFGGRIAWVLPRSLSQSIYGRDLLKFLQRKFSVVLVVSLEQRLFTSAGTEEITDVLIAEQFDAGSQTLGSFVHLYAQSLSDLTNILKNDVLPVPAITVASAAGNPSRSVALNPDERNALKALDTLPASRQLGELIEIRIGLVTGASNFFVLRRSCLEKKGLRRSDCQVVISKYRHTAGLEITRIDTSALGASNERALLIKCSQNKRSIRVNEYLKAFPVKALKKIKTFKKRNPWYNLDDRQISDAFLPCLVRGGPRMVINRASVNCTNNVLRVRFLPTDDDFLPELFCPFTCLYFGPTSRRSIRESLWLGRSQDRAE